MTEKTGTVILLSGGLDSATALSWALSTLPPPYHTLSMFYGQRHSREREYASLLCQHHNIPTPVNFNLAQAFSVVGGSSLTSGLVHGNPSTEAVDRTPSELPPTFVPGRNLVFLSLACGFAYTQQAKHVVGGWNAVDYSGYPDCRPEFFEAFGLAAQRGLDTDIRIHAPLVHLSKAEIIQLGLRLKTPYALTWSCYSGGDTPCGICASCEIRRDGFAAVGIADPALAAL